MTTNYKSSVLAELAWRDRIDTTTHDELDALLATQSVVLYCGFDPTAVSLHIGNLIPLMGLLFFRRHGHRPLLLAGGATGRIGDPSGKDSERDFLDIAQLEANIAGNSAQLRTIFDRAMHMHPETMGEHASRADGWQAPIVNNYDWMKQWGFLDFLRDVGKHFRVNTMIAKDSVKNRLENRDQGLSFTEFSYMLIQGYDFFHLFDHHACRLQIGGSDQWGNITAGTELIRRKRGTAAYGLTMPLLLDSTGKKFGKSVAGAIFLDPEITSPYAFYQYWLNRDDADMERLFKSFTFLHRDEIEGLVGEVATGQNRGQVQKRLAHEITWLAHGRDEADAAVRASRMLFGERIEGLDDKALSTIFADVPTAEISRDALAAGISIIDLLVSTGLQPSKGAARRLVQQGGGYVNNTRMAADAVVDTSCLASESMLVLRAGKKKYLVVKVD